MPIYEFQCEKCGQPFEELVFGSAVDDVVCPDCGSQDVHKMISTFASRVAGGSTPTLSASSAASCGSGSV